MRRLLLALPLGAAIGLLSAGRAASRPDDFGVLKGAPAAAGTKVPAGVEPAAAPPPNPYPIGPEAGEWVICAASYVGPDGVTLSRQVCESLRQQHRLAAYIFNRGEEERRKHEEEWQKQRAAYPPGTPLRKRTVRIPDQYAVLVGGFKDFSHASAYLPKLKALPDPKLKLDGGRSAYEVMTYQEPVPDKKETVVKRAYVHPYHNAMVVRNPLSASGKASKPKWDPFWKQLNADEEHSLLKCPKPWTLVVKEYMGGRALQSRGKETGGGFLSALGLGGSKGEVLEAAALQARELAKFLRHPRFGFKTYVLHTRHSSVVCVGEFNGPDDPEMKRVANHLKSMNFRTKEGADPIGLLPEPVPVEVPRF